MTDEQIFRNEIQCVTRRANGKCNGGTDCVSCDLVMKDAEIIACYQRAIDNINLLQSSVIKMSEKRINKNEFDCSLCKSCDHSMILSMTGKEELYCYYARNIMDVTTFEICPRGLQEDVTE